jgi:hypothetical protein
MLSEHLILSLGSSPGSRIMPWFSNRLFMLGNYLIWDMVFFTDCFYSWYDALLTASHDDLICSISPDFPCTSLNSSL